MPQWGGGYQPKLRRFEVGDYVYLRLGQVYSTLEVPTRAEVLRM